MQDSLAVLRDGSTDLTATEAYTGATAKKLGSTLPRTARFLLVSVPIAPTGTTPAATFSLWGCHTVGGTYVKVCSSDALSAKGQVAVPFVSDYEYFKLDVTVSGTTPNFGKTVVEVTPYVRGPHDMPNR